MLGMIPIDETVAEHNLAGTPILELPSQSPALSAYRQIVENHLVG